VHSDVEQKATKRADGALVITMQASEFGPKNPSCLPGVLFTLTGTPDDSGAEPIELVAPYSTP
jgi:hypothetical protein